MIISVSAPAGLEGVTKREIYNLIRKDGKAQNGKISFEGDIQDVAKCNLYLRTASRVYINVGSFKCESFDEFFDGIKSINWEDYIYPDGQIFITATLVESKLTAVSATCSVCKKAICDRLIQKTKKKVTETKERYKVDIVIHRDFAEIYLDTSGDGLHKRGYRQIGVGQAPLKENVAAALLDLSYWNPSRPLVDLFCGSGTIPIEAALICKKRAPGINRDFDFLHFQTFDTSFYANMKEEAIANEVTRDDLYICGYDIDDREISIARKHAKNAGVDDIIHFQKQDMRDFSTKKTNGIIISNPPYGERLMDLKEINALYTDYGKVFKSLEKLNWCNYTITSMKDFERLFGRKADKKRKMYNGNLECCYYSFVAAPPKK